MKNKMQIKTYYILLTAGVVALVILLNLAAGALGEKLPLKLDLTKNKIFELSEETKNVLKNVTEDVDIYYFVTRGRENSYIQQTIDMYKGYNSNIHFTQKDPADDPVFTKSIGDKISDNSVVVKCGDRTKIVDGTSSFDTTYQNMNMVFFNIEKKITRAIDYVINGSDVNILFTSGHEEIGYGLMKEALEDENAAVSEIDLKTADIDESTTALYIIGPSRDFSSDEITKVQSFVANGGALNISLDYGNDLPLLCSYLSQYFGINYANDIVMETDKSGILMDNPYYILPKAAEHDITRNMIEGKLSVVWPNARSISIAEKSAVTAKPLLTTSDKAVSKAANSENVSYEVSESDVKMSYILAAAIEYTSDIGKTARIIATGSSLYAASMFVSQPSVANADFLRNTLNYLIGDEVSSISVTPKNVAQEYLTLTNEEKTRYMWVYGILPGVLMLLAGLGIFIRRRHL